MLCDVADVDGDVGGAPEAIDTAALRNNAPICRSSLRTPASRV